MAGPFFQMLNNAPTPVGPTEGSGLGAVGQGLMTLSSVLDTGLEIRDEIGVDQFKQEVADIQKNAAEMDVEEDSREVTSQLNDTQKLLQRYEQGLLKRQMTEGLLKAERDKFVAKFPRRQREIDTLLKSTGFGSLAPSGVSAETPQQKAIRAASERVNEIMVNLNLSQQQAYNEFIRENAAARSRQIRADNTAARIAAAQEGEQRYNVASAEADSVGGAITESVLNEAVIGVPSRILNPNAADTDISQVSVLQALQAIDESTTVSREEKDDLFNEVLRSAKREVDNGLNQTYAALRANDVTVDEKLKEIYQSNPNIILNNLKELVAQGSVSNTIKRTQGIQLNQIQMALLNSNSPAATAASAAISKDPSKAFEIIQQVSEVGRLMNDPMKKQAFIAKAGNDARAAEQLELYKLLANNSAIPRVLKVETYLTEYLETLEIPQELNALAGTEVVEPLNSTWKAAIEDQRTDKEVRDAVNKVNLPEGETPTILTQENKKTRSWQLSMANAALMGQLMSPTARKALVGDPLAQKTYETAFANTVTSNAIGTVNDVATFEGSVSIDLPANANDAVIRSGFGATGRGGRRTAKPANMVEGSYSAPSRSGMGRGLPKDQVKKVDLRQLDAMIAPLYYYKTPVEVEEFVSSNLAAQLAALGLDVYLNGKKVVVKGQDNDGPAYSGLEDGTYEDADGNIIYIKDGKQVGN